MKACCSNKRQKNLADLLTLGRSIGQEKRIGKRVNFEKRV